MFHHNADAAALGVFQAVKESKGVYVFGSNSDQTSLAPDRVVGSAVIDLPRAFLLVAEEVKAGKFTPKVETFGLASGVIRYVSNPRLDSLVPRRPQGPCGGSGGLDREGHPSPAGPAAKQASVVNGRVARAGN